MAAITRPMMNSPMPPDVPPAPRNFGVGSLPTGSPLSCAFPPHSAPLQRRARLLPRLPNRGQSVCCRSAAAGGSLCAISTSPTCVELLENRDFIEFLPQLVPQDARRSRITAIRYHDPLWGGNPVQRDIVARHLDFPLCGDLQRMDCGDDRDLLVEQASFPAQSIFQI